MEATGIATAAADLMEGGGVGVPPIAADFDAGDLIRGGVLNHSFTTSAGDLPITWGSLVATGPGGAVPNIAPTLNADGTFSWNSGFSAFGTWTFDATATNGAGTDVGRLTVDVIIPEPATMSLLGLAMIGLVGYFGRRGR